MKIPKTFRPERNLEQKIEGLSKDNTKDFRLKYLIYEGIDIIGSGCDSKCIFNVIFTLDNDTQVSLYYASGPFYEKNLVSIEGSNLGLESVEVVSPIKNPVEVIEQTFSENPFNYKELPFQHTEFELEDRVIPKVKKRMFRRNEQTFFGNSLVIDRMTFEPEDKGDSYKVNAGRFYQITRSKDVITAKGITASILRILSDNMLGGSLCFHTMSLYQALPFTEKEKELLSGLKTFKTSYRFSRPESDEKDSKHLFDFRIEKKENEYQAFIRISDGFASGLDLISVWQAENLFDYLKSAKTINHYDIEAYKKSTQMHGFLQKTYTTKIF